MDKYVFAASALRLNESVPLLRIEPLHSAARHFQISKLTSNDSVAKVRCQFLPLRRRDRIPCCRGSQRDGRAHEVAFADLDAAVAQNVIGGRVMEIEVRQAKIQQQDLSGEFTLGAAGELDRDLLVLRAVDLGRLQALDEIDRP